MSRAARAASAAANDDVRGVDPRSQRASQRGQADDIRGASGDVHVVQPGETLSAIAAARLGRSDRWREIADLNGISDPRALRVGTQLKLPAGAAAEPDRAPAEAGVEAGAAAADRAPASPDAASVAPGAGVASGAGAAAGARAGAATGSRSDDPLAVERGQITFDVEGNDNADSRYYSRRLHHPSAGSGVTLGRGYDMGQRSGEQVRRELTLAELDPGTVGRLVPAAGLTGKAATRFCADNADIEVTHAQQKLLFSISYGEKEAVAADCLKRWSGMSLDSLDPVARDIIVDLFYRGDLTRTKWQTHDMASAVTDPTRLRSLLANRELWGNVDTNRYQTRLAYLDRPRDAQAEPAPEPGDEAPGQAPSPMGRGVVTADTLNVRAQPTTTGNSPIAKLSKGATVEVVEVRGEWLRISHGGSTAWVHGGFVDLEASASAAGGAGGASSAGQKAGTGAIAAAAAGAAAGRITGDLQTLMSQERLTPAQVSRARELIAEAPAAQQAGLYEQLQAKVPYHSQRDNESRANGANVNNMCNLTTLAMCLEYLGVSNPGTLDGKQYGQFEDYLEALRVQKGLGPRTYASTLKSLAAQMGVAGWQSIPVGRDGFETWAQRRDTYLRAGKAILLSIGGHIVRVQGVTEAGLVVDDPYGVVQLKPGAAGTSGNYSWKAYNTKYEADDAGEDNVWLWADVSAHGMKWAVAIG